MHQDFAELMLANLTMTAEAVV